ncbi:hydroxyproline-rich glycoprotein family protein [Trema orientale]|uniref:Hydroxyproline-rich glycoprotein family protein n=1 Tax=Trema orientale TaxID=63057 RepID=A0A2P5EG87_TREOI|nr:hydroxyproline-rich glycoprotein family protein [Trema orientale]
MRGASSGESSRAVNNNTLETINAAATAIAFAESRAPQASVRKRRWGSCWSIYRCFGSPKNRKRIGHAVLVPETAQPGNSAPRAENPAQAPAIVLPFIAPPSSPASFLQSEPPSATQSPAGLISVSASMYSPGGPTSIFAIGPYAHETQLVSPPVFSTFTTEPSTAPFTPPPESVHLTTPSSPEVPFAQLLDPKIRSGEPGQRFPIFHNEFQSYQLQPGSPVGHLISPSSGISGSGTSSPFPDGEFASSGPHFLEFRTGDPPKLLNLDKLSKFDWGSRQGSGSLTPDTVKPTPSDGFVLKTQTFEVAPNLHSNFRYRNGETVADHRVSFELTSEDVVRCVEKKTLALAEAVSTSLRDTSMMEREERSNKMANGYEQHRVGETSNEAPEKAPACVEEVPWHHKHRSITLGSAKEFNFDNADAGDSHKSEISSDWWANEKVAGKEGSPNQNWSFFPMMQPGFS